ncbi:recombinase RecA [Tunturiibacter gelidiferens]|uniref:Protein RecA n=1 Tax=Tunturiibacter gelidiferens TaxID=3069689 RepID=A0AAU7YZG1_9BACT
MPTTATIRTQIEAALAHKIPSALTPAPKMIRPVAETGIQSLDNLLQGGLPIGAISELVGPECSGRTDIALSFVAHLTQASKVCAWIDASNNFDPVSAAAAGVDLERLLWVRCGAVQEAEKRPARTFVLPDRYLVPRPAKQGLHGGGCGAHPRGEAKGLSGAVSDLLGPQSFAPRCAEPQRRAREERPSFVASDEPTAVTSRRYVPTSKPWGRIEQALGAADLLLQGGGFSGVVLDMAGLAPEFVSRIQLSTWFRYRAAAERTQSSVLLLTQHPCAKSSAELLLLLQPAEVISNDATVFTGIQPHVEVTRRRFAPNTSNVVLLRKPPKNVTGVTWDCRTAWAGAR